MDDQPILFSNQNSFDLNAQIKSTACVVKIKTEQWHLASWKSCGLGGGYCVSGSQWVAEIIGQICVAKSRQYCSKLTLEETTVHFALLKKA